LGTQDELYQVAIGDYNQGERENARENAEQYLKYRLGDEFCAGKHERSLLKVVLYPSLNDCMLNQRFGVIFGREHPVLKFEFSTLKEKLLHESECERFRMH